MLGHRTLRITLLAVLILTALPLALWAVSVQGTPSTIDQVGAEIGGLVALGLGAIASFLTQRSKRLLTPLENASPLVKQIVAFGWAMGLVWVANRIPPLAAILPGDPTLLPTAMTGLVAWAAALAAHAIKKGVEGKVTP